MDADRQAVEISRRMSQVGGYDFYRTMSAAILAHVQGKPQDEIDYILNSSHRPSEIHHNRTAFEGYLTRFGKKKGLEVFQRQASLRLMDGKMEISCSPLFTHETSKGVTAYQVWAAQEPKIDRRRASIGCYILEKSFKKTSSANYNFALFDATTNKVFTGVNNEAGAAVEIAARNMVHWAEMHS